MTDLQKVTREALTNLAALAASDARELRRRAAGLEKVSAEISAALAADAAEPALAALASDATWYADPILPDLKARAQVTMAYLRAWVIGGGQ